MISSSGKLSTESFLATSDFLLMMSVHLGQTVDRGALHLKASSKKTECVELRLVN